MTDIQGLIDRAELTDVLVKFHRAVDYGTWDLLHTDVLTEGVEWESVASDCDGSLEDAISGRDTFVSWLSAAMTGATANHLTSNHLYEIDGDSAHTESHMIVVDRTTLTTLATGLVKATYARTPEGWRISHLRIEERMIDGTISGMKERLGLATSEPA
jgi:hypothetical protein